MAFTRIVGANLGGTELPILVTITYKENVTDLAVGYKDYRAFIQRLRHTYGNGFRYICAPEFQARGAVHFHALFWGLPAEVQLQERRTRTIAELWGHGFVFIKPTDGDEKLSKYLAKYMAKAFTDRRLRNKKAYVASRNVVRPVVGRRFSPSWVVVEEYVGDMPAVFDKSYYAGRLGNCRRRIYKRSKE